MGFIDLEFVWDQTGNGRFFAFYGTDYLNADYVKVQTPLARLRHCGDTSGPLQGQRVHSRGQDKMSKQTRVDCEKEEEE